MKNSNQALGLLNGIALLFCFVFAGEAMATDFFSIAPMLTQRNQHTATRLADGRVLIVGGSVFSGGSSTLAELYNPTGSSGASFTAAGSMSTPRTGHTATLLADGKVLIAGGSSNGAASGALSSAELYDPATGSFSLIAGGMTAARSFHTAALLPDGRVLIAGGANSTATLASAELYDPATGSFAATGTMAKTRQRHTATPLPGGKVLIAGGIGNNVLFPFHGELYDPATGIFTATVGSLAALRFNHAATALADGKVLFTGDATASAELYDPATDSFLAAGSMTEARSRHSATLLTDGTVLLAGGGFNNGTVSSNGSLAELYDPASGHFTPIVHILTVPRAAHTGTLLADGRVLLAGGAQAGGFDVTAELYGFNQPPIANAGPDQNIYLGQSTRVSGAASFDPEGSTLSYMWVLESRPAGSTAVLGSPAGVETMITPDVIGQYVISLVMNDGVQDGVADTMILNVSRNLPPVAAATGTPSSGNAPLLVMFNAGASTDPEGGPLSYSWNFGDGSSTPATFVNPNHTYGSPGNYTAVVTVTDNFGNTDQAAVPITVTAPNMPPSVAPTATSSSGTAPLLVQFAANAVDPEGAALTYAWSFGDGTPVSVLANPSHTYVTPGAYTASVTVSDGTYSVTGTVVVSVGSALSVNVTEAKVDFGRRGKVDGKIDMKADFVFPGTPKGNIKVVFDGVTILDVPFSKFKRERSGEYEAKNVHAEIDLARGKLKVSHHKMLLTGIDNSNGIDVVISFGSAAGTDHFVMHERIHDHERVLLFHAKHDRRHGHEHDRDDRDRDRDDDHHRSRR